MAWQLMVEVLDHAPACLTPAEKLVLLAIAERTRLDDRYCPPIPTEELARRAQVAPSSLGKVFGRLVLERVATDDHADRGPGSFRPGPRSFRSTVGGTGGTGEPGEFCPPSAPHRVRGRCASAPGQDVTPRGGRGSVSRVRRSGPRRAR